MNSFSDDIELVEYFRQGEGRAFKRLHDHFFRQLCYFADKLIENKEEAEDIVTNCFVKLWEKRNDFNSVQKIKSFLYLSTRNACLNWLKHIRVENRSFKEIRFLSGNEDPILNELVEAQVLQAIYEEIENLAPQCREIFKLLFLKGKSTAEIAEQMSINVQTVRNQKTKALQEIRMAMFKRDLPMWAVMFILAAIAQENLN